MPSYNKTFDLSVEDLELIETALRDKKRELSEQAHDARCDVSDEVIVCRDTTDEMRTIHDLLGRLHNQKVFFRPQRQTYVGG